MATAADVVRIARRSEALKSLSLGDAPLIDVTPFARFPEMQKAVLDFNERQKLSYDRLKNLLAEALLAARDVPP
jgi:hypothetical protein